MTVKNGATALPFRSDMCHSIAWEGNHFLSRLEVTISSQKAQQLPVSLLRVRSKAANCKITRRQKVEIHVQLHVTRYPADHGV